MIRILVVDDNHIPREIIRQVLEKYKIDVKEAANGVEAQNLIKDNKFDLVITDLIMPEMNGYDLCRWIKKNEKTKNIPVIICTTKGEEFDRVWGIRQGADAYITKPFDPQELLKTIKFLLKHSKPQS
jgi:twitching motility two-component system response regulator PilH